MTEMNNAPQPEPASGGGAAPAPSIAQPIDVSFLDAAIAPPEPAPMPGAPQYVDQRTPPPMPIQPQRGGYDPQDELTTLVGDTRGYVQSIVREVLSERADPAIQDMTLASRRISDFIKSTADAEVYNARNNVEGLIQKVFKQDEEYMSNPELRETVNRSLGNILHNSANAARNGQFDAIKKLSSWGPNQAMAALAAAKQLYGPAGVQSVPVGEGRQTFTEPVAQQTQDYTVEITPEEESVIAFQERLDPSFRERFIASKRTAIERGDWEF